MSVELRVLSGARAGTRERFDKSVIALGRHPLSDLQLDAQRDLDVSTRHAELRGVDGVWTIHDNASTNGTFVNGTRLPSGGTHTLRSGDTIQLGASGPSIEVTFSGAPSTGATPAAAPRRPTAERVAEAVHTQTAPLRRALYATLAAMLVLAATGAFLWQREASARAHASALDSLAHTAPSRARVGMDLEAVHDANDAAIAFVVTDMGGSYTAGTAFGVAPNGRLVTNRHLVRTAAGDTARRVAVMFANTTAWLPARVVRTSDRDDLALLQIDGGGSYPVVAGVSATDSLSHVGAPIATIGFPLAVDTPMEGKTAGLQITARTTTTGGTVSKRLADVLQIDSYAGKGSSGSPVFDASGRVVGVVYGGQAASHGRIVYAVPGARVAAFVAAK